METTKKISSALVLGAAAAAVGVGALLGVLMAPRSGSETRQKIMDGAKDLAENTKERIKEGVGRVKEKANEFANKAEEKVDEYKNMVKGKVESIKTSSSKGDYA